MSIHTVLAHLAPIAQQLRAQIKREEGDDKAVFMAVLEAGFLVASADGEIDNAELSTLKRAFAVLVEGISSQAMDELIRSFTEKRQLEGETTRCNAVGEVLFKAKASEEGIFLAAAIAYVSGGLSAPELSVMEHIATAARLSGASLATIATSVRDEIARRKGTDL